MISIGTGGASGVCAVFRDIGTASFPATGAPDMRLTVMIHNSKNAQNNSHFAVGIFVRMAKPTSTFIYAFPIKTGTALSVI